MAGKDSTKRGQGPKQRAGGSAQESRKSLGRMRGTKQEKVQGEGDYEAAHKFNEAEERFVESGAAEEGARQAAPRSDQERRELKQAEDEARRHSKGEDPALKSGRSTR